MALIRPLAWEPTYALSEALKAGKKKKKKKPTDNSWAVKRGMHGKMVRSPKTAAGHAPKVHISWHVTGSKISFCEFTKSDLIHFLDRLVD